MDNYFSAKDILGKAIGTDAYFQIKSILFGLKAADVAPVVHARWVNVNREVEQMCRCSACGYPVSYFWSRTEYCPHCGAKMDG